VGIISLIFGLMIWICCMRILW